MPSLYSAHRSGPVLGTNRYGEHSRNREDATGAVIPHAKITIVHTETARQNTTVANDIGFYLFPSIQVGAYAKISVEAAGMETWKGNLIWSPARQPPWIRRSNWRPPRRRSRWLADVTPLVTTTSPTVATVVERERIEQLPINGRFVTNLIYMIDAGSGVRFRTP